MTCVAMDTMDAKVAMDTKGAIGVNAAMDTLVNKVTIVVIDTPCVSSQSHCDRCKSCCSKRLGKPQVRNPKPMQVWTPTPFKTSFKSPHMAPRPPEKNTSTPGKPHGTLYSFLLLTLTSVLLPLATAAPQWRVMPSDSDVELNGSVVLHCEVENLEGRGVEWRQYHDDGSDTTLFSNDMRFDAPARFDVIDNGYGYSLALNGAQREDDADFQCGIANYDEKRARITVLVEPSPPTISINSSDLTAGDIVELHCSSTDGNPAPDFTWRRDDENLTATETFPPGDKYGTAASVLLRSLSATDHNAEYECGVYNEAVVVPKTTSLILTVKYAPVIYLGAHDPYSVIEATAASLTCVVDANPAVTSGDVTWHTDGNLLGTGFELTFANVSRADSREYRCEATNVVGSGSGDIQLDVLYGPEISLKFSVGEFKDDTLRIHERSALNISCVVNSNPETIYNNIRFLQDGQVIKLGPVLEVAMVTRENSGEYSCDATTTLIPSEGDGVTRKQERFFTIQVLYAPGEATIDVPELVLKGESATLRCNVSDPGEPKGWLLWSRLDQPGTIHNGSELVFSPVTLDDHGDYICTPENEVATGTSDMALMEVNERPEWVTGPLPSELTVPVNTTLLELVCQVRGKPLPVVTWLKDGTELPHNGLHVVNASQQPVDTHSWNVTSHLYFQGGSRTPTSGSLSHTDAGNYTCVGANDLGDVQSELQLHIQYAPVIEATSEKVTIDKNQSAHMCCYAHSYPSTAFQWYNASKEIVPGSRIHISDEVVGGDFPYQTTITIYNATNGDLGDYDCRGCNLMGCNQATIHLTVKDVPDVPESLVQTSQTWESVGLAWTAGFDGGYPQTFQLMYRYYDNSSQGYQEEWVQAGGVEEYNVTGLFPSVRYTFRVYGENTLGLSDPSNSVVTTTDDYTVPVPGQVRYDEKSRILSFTSPSVNYCARIEINSGSSWQLYEECAPAEGSVLIDDGWVVRNICVALCLTRRQDVCSLPVYAEFVGEDLPKETIIIVGCVCGGVVVILTIVLIVLCCKRTKAQKDYNKQQANSNQMQPVIASPGATDTDRPPDSAPPLKPAIKGLDNPGLDHPDSAVHQREPSVYTTDASRDLRPSHPNGHGPHGNWPQAPPPSYDSSNPYRPQHTGSPVSGKTKLYLDDPYADSHRDHSNVSESGISDVQKPRKVIYEVVV